VGETFGGIRIEEVTVLALAIVAAWAAFGALAVVFMRRRGHDAFAWAIVFFVLGPLALPMALSASRNPPVATESPVHPGELDVLAAHDGSPAASAALDAALELLGPQMTSLTLATVVDIEAATTVQGRENESEAEERLDAVAGQLAALPCGPVDTVVLYGDPARALVQFAAEHGYELIVVGGSGPGGRIVRRGSVARRLATGTNVPLLVGPVHR
jgi:nucleotide-binding universal stress UspA family protein